MTEHCLYIHVSMQYVVHVDFANQVSISCFVYSTLGIFSPLEWGAKGGREGGGREERREGEGQEGRGEGGREGGQEGETYITDQKTYKLTAYSCKQCQQTPSSWPCTLDQ